MSILTTQALAQDNGAKVDKVFGFAGATTPGCSCTISKNGSVVLNRSYGAANLQTGALITEHSAFDIGSTRKQLIAAVILMLVREKRLSLTDDIRQYMKELPKYGHRITIDHLLTHTSGIRDWTGLLPLAKGNPTALSLILRQRGLNFVPGEEWSYSNSGYVLLTEIAERVAKTSFASLISEYIFAPLSMKNTTYVTDMAAGVPGQAIGYARQGDTWKINMYLGNDRGGGAIFSTTNDLTIWNNALSTGRLGEFVTNKLQEAAQLNNGRKLGYARGLTLDPYRDTELVWHSGGAAGYNTWIGRIPSQGLSVAITCNTDNASTNNIANQLLGIYVNSSAKPNTEDGPPAALTGEALAEANRLTGLYFNEQTGDPMTLALDRDRFRIVGGPGLVATSKGRFRRWGATIFYRSQDKFDLFFTTTERFELTSMEGKKSLYRKARAVSPTLAELAAIQGKYHSDELDASIELSVQDGLLKGRLNDQEDLLEFRPVDTDAFQFAGMYLQLVRGKSGNVVAFNYRNPVVSNIKFEKIENSKKQ